MQKNIILVKIERMRGSDAFMSSAYEVSYDLERERRQALYNARVSATTEKFYSRYLEQYNQMCQRGFEAYIPDEMNRLKYDLSQIRSLLVANPVEAREISYRVGHYIKNMSSLADAAVEQFDRIGRMRLQQRREEKAFRKNKLMNLYFEMTEDISNPIIINYSIPAFKELRQRIEQEDIKSEEILKTEIVRIISESKEKADEWKNNTVSKNHKKNVSEKIKETEQRLKKEKIENDEKNKELKEKLEHLKENVTKSNVACEDIENEISNIETDIDDELITEEIRRETVKAIIKQLKDQEFSVTRPTIREYKGKSYVRIIAKKPSGKRAICDVDLNGKIIYKFDKYEGMSCLKDIEKFNVDLEKIYSVKLSDERILWSNPDELTKDSREVPKSFGGKNG